MKFSSLLILLLFVTGGIWGQVPGPNLNEGFEDGIIPDNWTVINADGGTKVWTAQTSNPHTGLYAARVQYETSSLSNDDWLITPPLYVTSATTDEISFWMRTYNATSSDPWEVLVSTTNTSPASFTMIDSGDGMLGEYVQKTYSLDEYGDAVVYVAIRSIGSYDWYVYVDDFTGPSVMVPTCPKPTGLTAENPTINSIELGWTAGNTETMWDVLYGAAGFDPETEGTLVTGIESNPYVLENLTPSTVYEYYVRAVCGEDEVSLWAGPKLFNTLCTSVSLPLIEHFTYVTTPELPLCWSSIVTNTTNTFANVQTTTLYPVSPPHSVKLYNSSADTAEILLITPEISDPLAGNRVMFSARGGANYSLLIGTLSDPTDPATFTMVGEVSPTGDHSPFQVSFADYAGTDSYIAFKHGNTGGSQTIYIDDIVIEILPDCIEPIELTVSNITNNTASVGWTAQGDETTWDIVYGTSGFDPQTGGTTVAGVTENPYTLTGLTSATTYEFYVRADCGGDVSVWSGPVAFVTFCDPFDLPFLENFDGAATGSFPICWSKAGLATTNWTISNSSNALGTVPELRFGYSPSFTGEALMVSPVINTTGETSLAIEFKHYYDDYAVPFTFGMKTTSDGTTWNTIWEVVDPVGNIGPEEVLIDVNNSDVGSPTFQFAFFVDGYTFNMNNWYMDDIHVFVPQVGNLEGTVTEATRGPIEGALITADDHQTYTDASGYYIIENMMTGIYDVTCEAEGYFPVTVEDIEILANQTITQDFTLGYATISVAPESLLQNLMPGETATQMLTISNAEGTGPLNWKAQIQLQEPSDFYFLNTQQEKMKPNANVDETDPNSTHGNPVSTDAMYDLLGSFPLFDVGGTYSSATDGNFIYTGRWNANQYDKYDMEGNHIESFSIPGAGLTRDLTYDGQYFYGSPNSDLIYQMDFETQTLVNTIVASGNAIRGIAYDEDDDAFWVAGSSFSGPFRQISREGTVLQTVTTTLGGMSGLAYDNASPDGPYLWAYTPSTSTGEHIINKINLANGSVIESFDVTTTGIPVLPGGTSGGLNITNLAVPGKWVIMGIVQNEIAWILELADSDSWLTLDISSGVVNPGESTNVEVTFDAGELPPGTYLADIKIIHNGQELTDGSVIVPVSMIVTEPGAPLPPYNPIPPSGATMVSLQPELSWTNGAGTSEVQVNIRTVTGPFTTTVYKSEWFTGSSFNLADVPLTLLADKEYNWRVYARNSIATTKGPRWTFTTAGVGTIEGIVTDASTSAPLQGVTITTEPEGYTATTDASGAYSITNVSSGTYDVTAALDGYTSESQEVTVGEGQTVIANFELTKPLAPPTNLQAVVEDFVNVNLSWVAPEGGTGGGLYELSYHLGTPNNAYFELWDYVYGVVYDVSGFTNVTIEKADYHHASWGTMGIWDYKLHIVDWDTYTLISSTPVLQTTGDDKWEVNVPLGSIPESGLVGIFLEPMGNAANDAFPNLSSDDNATTTNSFFGPISDFSNLNPGTIGNFLMDLWIMADPLDGGERILVQAPIIEGATTVSHQSRAVHGNISTPIAPIEYTGANRALTGFNVYRNGDFLVNTDASTTEIDDLNLEGGTYAYTVTAVYTEGESEAAGPATVGILPPPVLVSAEPDFLGVELAWEKGTNYPTDAKPGIYTTSNVELMSEKKEPAHGITNEVPKATSGREIGDDCDNPIILDMTTLPVVDVNTTCGRGNNYEETCLGSYDSGEDIVYQFTLTETKDLKFTLATTTTYTGMLITQECPISTNCVTFVTGSGGDKMMQAVLEAGTYYVMIDTWAAPDCIPEFTLTIEEFVVLPGDNCDNPIVIDALPYTDENTTCGRGNTYMETCLGSYDGGQDIVYQIVPTENMKVEFDITTTATWTGMLITEECPIGMNCVSFITGASGPKTMVVDLVAGTSYYFMLDTYPSPDCFDFTLNVTEIEPCILEMPAGAIAEGEPCIEDEGEDVTNGGCNMDNPMFTPINLGDVIWGTGSTYLVGASKSRDTDWYELVITEPKTVTLTVIAEFPVVAGFIEQIIPGVPGCENITGSISPAELADPCEEFTVSSTLIPGTYYLFVGVSVFEGYPCGTSNNYIAELTSESVFLPHFNVYRDGEQIAESYLMNYYDQADITNGETYCYTVSEVPAVGFETGMSNELCTTIPQMPEIAVNPASITETHIIPPAQITTQTVTLTNNGAGELDWILALEPDGEYCDASTNYEDEFISNVLCGDINNPSGWQSAISDYTDISTNIAPGASEPIIVTNGSPSSSDKATCWVDWNLDYTFGVGTSEEFILTTDDGAATFTGDITVPEGTPAGSYRMRVRLTYSTAPAPCGVASYGEVEDYTITVGQSWLSADILEGTLAPGASTDITLTFDSEGLEVGVYSKELNFMSNDPTTPILTVPVQLSVEISAIGTIAGHVTDALSRGPVANATITIDELRYTTTTDEDGFYELEVQAGDYLVTAAKTGYITQTAEVTVVVDLTTTQDFLLEFAAPILLYANGGVGEINLGWTGNPAAPYDNGARYSVTNMEYKNNVALIDKDEQAHGITNEVPKATSRREIGDDCDNPWILDVNTLPVVDTNTTCGRGNTYSETCLGNYDGGEDIVYQFTLTEAKMLKLTLTTATTWTGMLITQECPISTNCVAFITGSTGNKVITTALEAGTYYVMMDTWPTPNCIDELIFTIDEFIPEPGELCTTAIDYGFVNDDPVLGAIEPSEAVWYSFTADQNFGSVDVSLCGSSFDTKLEVWYNCDDATYAYYNDDSQVCNAKAAQSFISTGPMQAGQTWYAKVYGYSTNAGDYILEVTGVEACVLEMPAGAIAEGEPCIENEGEDVTNGGCNMDEPMFTTINCGDVIWGSSSTYLVGTSKRRDTDWYQLEITEPKTVTFSVTAEFPSVAGIVEQTVPGVAGCDNITGSISPAATAEPCEEASVTVTLVPGTYYFFVGISVFEGYPCGMSNNYIAELTCEEAFIPYYDVFRDDAFLAQTYLETYTDNEVLPDVEYCYTVRQFIEPDVVTPQSNELCASMLCAAGCNYIFLLTDQFGDGWNGASFTIMQGGSEIGTYTLASGDMEILEVNLCDATETSFIWNSGLYDGECAFEIYDPEYNSLYYFEFYENPSNGEVFFTFITDCPALLGQDIVLTEGWSAWSSYVALADPANISDVMAPVVDDMVMTKHFEEIFYPDYGLNTIGMFSNNHGYLTNMTAERTLTISGEMADPTIYLQTGWNLISVLQECSILAEGVFSSINGFDIAWEPTGNGIYYPEGNLYTLTNLIPGKAYYVNVTEAGEYTYPGCDKSSGNMFSAPLRAANTTSWNDVTYTGVNHVVVFDSKATNNLRIGDMIGAFANESVCAGLVEYTGANLGFTLFGDDISTPGAEGFVDGNVITYKVFRAETGEEFTMDVVYSLDAPNSSTFAAYGLSVITDLKLAPLSIGENTLKNLSIYPNPSSGIFNIAVSGLDTQVDYVVMNAQGQEVYSGNLMESQQLDLSNEAKGVYFIKFISDTVLRVEKLVVK